MRSDFYVVELVVLEQPIDGLLTVLFPMGAKIRYELFGKPISGAFWATCRVRNIAWFPFLYGCPRCSPRFDEPFILVEWLSSICMVIHISNWHFAGLQGVTYGCERHKPHVRIDRLP